MSKNGIPQGSILGSFRLILQINNISRISDTVVTLYTDNTSLIYSKEIIEWKLLDEF